METVPLIVATLASAATVSLLSQLVRRVDALLSVIEDSRSVIEDSRYAHEPPSTTASAE